MLQYFEETVFDKRQANSEARNAVNVAPAEFKQAALARYALSSRELAVAEATLTEERAILKVERLMILVENSTAGAITKLKKAEKELRVARRTRAKAIEELEGVLVS